MAKKYWTTIEGEEIEYKKLDKFHLLNILKWIERRADKGMTIKMGGGDSWDPESFWYDEHEIIGNEVLERYDYKGLRKEALRRKLIKIKK